MTDSKWHTVITTEDESGQAETWRVGYRRLTARQMLEVTSAAAEEGNAAQKTIDAANMICTYIQCNDVAVEMFDDVPFDVLDDAVGNHPSFRVGVSEA